jgi:hypothetical protein
LIFDPNRVDCKIEQIESDRQIGIQRRQKPHFNASGQELAGEFEIEKKFHSANIHAGQAIVCVGAAAR